MRLWVSGVFSNAGPYCEQYYQSQYQWLPVWPCSSSASPQTAPLSHHPPSSPAAPGSQSQRGTPLPAHNRLMGWLTMATGPSRPSQQSRREAERPTRETTPYQELLMWRSIQILIEWFHLRQTFVFRVWKNGQKNKCFLKKSTYSIEQK